MALKWFTPGDQEYSPFSFFGRLILPGAIAFAFFLLCFLIIPGESAMILGGLMILYFIPPAGKESIIPLGIALGIPWWLMAISLALLDVLTGLFMILNFGIALRIPYLGPWISRFIASGNDFILERPWLARWRTLGVAFFVFLPFQGTGGVGATIVGMMVGLSPAKILLAIAIGGSLECLMFALGSELIWNLILTNVYLGIGVAALVIIAAVVAFLVFRRISS
jgi:uncharacterized membrane protein